MTLDDLARLRVLPIIVIDDARWAAPLARALIAGGIPGAEVTLRTPAAPAAIAGMAALEGFLVAAGTVLSAADVDRAVGAGASAVVSPGFDARVVERARRCEVVALPGVATAGELMTAVAAGLSAVKLFPVAQLGGPGIVSALNGPFPEVRFVPSGGIDLDNAAGYDVDAVLALGTSWIAPRALIAQERFAEITDRARAFRAVLNR